MIKLHQSGYISKSTAARQRMVADGDVMNSGENRCQYRQSNKAVRKSTRSPAVAEIADRTAYDALANNHLDNNTLNVSSNIT